MRDFRVAVGRDIIGWHEQVVVALEAAAAQRPWLSFEVVDLDHSDWIDQVASAQAVIWNPHFMGPQSAGLFKERVYFLETVLGKRVMPSFSTIWHFESKAAQSYLLDHLDVPRPRTLVTFDRAEALEKSAELGLPVVAKRSWGAGSSNVSLLKTRKDVETYIDRELVQQAWDESRSAHGSTRRAALASATEPWFGAKVRQAVLGGEWANLVYLQEFIPGNESDLRITVISGHAMTFWRHNRAHDFRASGSGLVDYDKDAPESALRLCLGISERTGADSMAYDILFRDGEPVVVEMSYGFVVEFVHDVQGNWTMGPRGELTYNEGKVWPQALWVERLISDLEGS